MATATERIVVQVTATQKKINCINCKTPWVERQ